MTQTDNKSPVKQPVTQTAMLLAAAMALPGVNAAHAEVAPERGMISFKYLDYLDSQGSFTDTISGASGSNSKDRVRVKSESLMAMVPIAGAWSVTGTFTGDAVSGASPAFHSNSIRRFDDHRTARSYSVTRYLPRGTITLGANQSYEHDYISRGFSLQAALESEDKNSTINAGIAVSNDEINSSNHVAEDEGKHVTDWILGVTQVLTANDIVQLNLGYSAGDGYFSDPYKSGDRRPESKDHYTILTRWNHHFKQTSGSSHLSYRYYNDTFGVIAHTIEAEYVQPFGNGWTVEPLARFYTQTAANFYVGIDPLSPAFPNPASLKYFSMDERLSEYGAVTLGFKVAKQINQDWRVDFKCEQYRQRESWALTGNNDGNLEPFSFRSYQFGISRSF